MSITGDVFASAPEPPEPPEDDAPRPSEPQRTARVVRVSDVAPERVRWLWPGYIPAGKLTLIDGDPGDGKSTLSLDLAARVSTGSPMPDGASGEGPAVVLVLSAEDGIADTIRPRLDAAGADVSRVLVLDEINEDGADRPPELPADLAAVEALIERHRIRLVTIDPLMAFLAGGVDSHRDQDVRRVLHPLSKLAESTGAAFLVIRHMNKARGGKALYRGGGSIGIVGAARAGYVVAADPDDETRRVLACSKMNVAAHPPALAYRLTEDPEHGCARVVWEGVVEHRADDLLRDQLDGEDRTERDEASAFLADLLGDGPVPAAEVKRKAKAAGIAERTLKRAKSALGVVSSKDGFTGGWSWSLPEGGQETPNSATRTGWTPSAEGGPLRDEHDEAGNVIRGAFPDARPVDEEPL